MGLVLIDVYLFVLPILDLSQMRFHEDASELPANDKNRIIIIIE